MAKRLMSDAEMRRRQKLQGKIGRTTSSMGLTALGVTGVAAVAGKKPGALKAVQKLPGLKNATPKGMESAALKSGIVSGGIGGIGGFNQASIYSAESRKRKQVVPVKKDLGMEMGYYGEEGRPIQIPEIRVPIEKAWQPVASNFDSEASRKKRAKGYQNASLVGAGAGGAYAGHHGMQAAHEASKIKVIPRAAQLKQVKDKTNLVTRHGKEFKALDADVVGRAARHGRKAAIGIAAVGAAAATHSAIKRKRSGAWQPYAKSATSAFGIEHV